MASNALYPPTPLNVPAEITRPDSAYRLRVLAMIGGLFLFLLLYLLFIAAAGWLAYWLISLPLLETRSGKGMIAMLLFKFGGAFAALLLWLFLFKGLFKGQRTDRSTHTQLSEKDHPELFAFIRQVYGETRSPAPRRVYASPEVNAALIYNTSLINLFVPPRKDLLIGLGLVNVVTLAEFKAIMAHEFGHFAQRSVGLGSYLYVANRVMHDVIYSRDALDRFVDDWSRQDIRVSFPAWGLKGVLWVVRQILGGTYKGLNLLHLSLSRQMEFNADNVAVSVTGSDALIHGLARLTFANECIADAAQSLDAAADHGVFTDNLFHHQNHAAPRLRRLSKEPKAGLPPELPPDPAARVQVFQPSNDGIPDLYRSHPTDYMREQNAKRIYIRSPLDDRSPWLLFNHAEALRTEVTEQFYKHLLNRREDYAPRPAADVQKFIDAEHAETTYDPKYHGLYDDRFINPGDVENIPEPIWPRSKAAAWLAAWPGGGIEKQVEAYQKRQGEFGLLRGLKSGEYQLKGKTFTFREETCTARDVDRLLKAVDKELDGDLEAFKKLDRDVFLAHRALARHLDDGGELIGPREDELLERYRFHMTCQTILQTMFGEQGRLQHILEFLGNNQQLEEADFNQVKETLRQIHRTLLDSLNSAQSVSVPALTNVPAGASLHSLILDRGDTSLPPLAGESISGQWIGKLIQRLEGMLSRVKRVHFKSLGSLLAKQEQMAVEWTAARDKAAGNSPRRA